MSALTQRRRPAVPRTVALALTAAVLAGAFAWQCRRHQPDLSGLDEARLTAELERLGYHVHAEPADREGALLPTGHPRAVLAGLYACRDEPADWEAAAAEPRTYDEDWRGSAVATPLRGRWVPPTPADAEDHLDAGPWLFFGDPAELDRIARGLGLPR
jgi:hypothetical protein